MSASTPKKEIILTIIENDLSTSSTKKFSATEESKIRSIWVRASKILNLFIPDNLVPGLTKQAKIAWREKVMLCAIIFGLSAMLLTYLIMLPSSMCPAANVMSQKEIAELPHYNPHVIIHGRVFDFTEFAAKHQHKASIPHHIFDYAGKDASALFPRPINSKSINDHRKKNVMINSGNENTFEPYYHSFQDFKIASNWPKSFDLCYNWKQISSASTSTTAWIVIDDKVFNITDLKNDLNDSDILNSIEKDIITVINDNNFKELISAPWGRDKSELFRYPKSGEHYDILLKGYQIGVIDYRESFQCKTSNFLMIASTGIVVLVLIVKFLASLQLGIKQEPEKLNRNVVILIPCYSEDSESLKRSINSVSNLEYDSRKKILVLIADGNVTGCGNTSSTPELLKSILGIKKLSRALIYQSVSTDGFEMNKAEIYFGHYKTDFNLPIPFILIVKVGCSHDSSDTGNRGKRDSQLILLKFFSRISYNLPLNPLEIEIYRGFFEDLEINPVDIEFILMIDADTELFSDGLNRLLACCVHDSKIIGI